MINQNHKATYTKTCNRTAKQSENMAHNCGAFWRGFERKRRAISFSFTRIFFSELAPFLKKIMRRISCIHCAKIAAKYACFQTSIDRINISAPIRRCRRNPLIAHECSLSTHLYYLCEMRKCFWFAAHDPFRGKIGVGSEQNSAKCAENRPTRGKKFSNHCFSYLESV